MNLQLLADLNLDPNLHLHLHLHLQFNINLDPNPKPGSPTDPAIRNLPASTTGQPTQLMQWHHIREASNDALLRVGGVGLS
jgi:hypothetical protein